MTTRVTRTAKPKPSEVETTETSMPETGTPDQVETTETDDVETDDTTNEDDTETDDQDTDPDALVNPLPKDDPRWAIGEAIVTQINMLRDALGGKDDELSRLKQDLADLDANRKKIVERINAIGPDVGNQQTLINQLVQQLNSYKTPLSLLSRRGNRAATSSNVGTSQAFVDRGLALANSMPAAFRNQDVCMAKPCNQNTAGGWLKKYKDAGVYAQNPDGSYSIAPEHAARAAEIK